MKAVGLVTARGGSKGVPGKNLAPVGGKPLIAWTAKAVAESRHVGRAILSTDSSEIADVGRAWGLEVPFMRPPELARDDTPHNLVIRHAIEWMRGHHGVPDFIVLLQPTSPLRTAADIDAAVELATTADANSVISVCRAPNHPFWTMRIDERGRLAPFVKASDENFYSRRQDLPDAYALNGAVYVIRTEAFLATNSYLGDRTYPYIMPEARSLDIDTRWDLYLANLLLSAPAFEDPS